MNLIEFLIVLFMLIVIINILNNRIFHIQSDIALVLFSTIISVIILIIDLLLGQKGITESITHSLGNFDFHDYLLDYMLGKR